MDQALEFVGVIALVLIVVEISGQSWDKWHAKRAPMERASKHGRK